jgi:hypothetical protein
MATYWQDIRKLGTVCFSLAGLALLILALVWPSQAEHFCRSRLAVACLGLVCVLLNSGLRGGMVIGFREFMKATAQVAEEIRRAIDGGDDDDGPRTT